MGAGENSYALLNLVNLKLHLKRTILLENSINPLLNIYKAYIMLQSFVSAAPHPLSYWEQRGL